MANNYRDITVNYYQLEPDVTGEGNYAVAKHDLQNFIRNLGGAVLRPVPKPDGWVTMTRLEENPAHWSGVISKVQTKDIPNKRNPHQLASTPIDINDEEGLDHPTCFILDRAMNILIIESLKNAVTANTFCDFLSQQLGFKLIAAVLPMNDAREKYDRMQRFKKLSFKLARLENTNNSRRRTRAVTSTLDLADETDSTQIYIEMGTGRDRGRLLNSDGIRRLIDGLLGGADDYELKSVEVHGSTGYHEGESFEPVDLIEQRIFDVIRVNRVRLLTEDHLNERLWAVINKYQNRRDNLLPLYGIHQRRT